MTVYETDVYQAIMGWIAEQSGVAYGDSPRRRRRTVCSRITAAA